MVPIMIINDDQLTKSAVKKYSSEISRWLDVPRAVLRKYNGEKRPAVLRDEALLALDNVQDALDFLMDNFIDEEKLLKHIKKH